MQERLLFAISVLKGTHACSRCTVLNAIAPSTGCLLLRRLYANEEQGNYLERLFGLNLANVPFLLALRLPDDERKKIK